MLHGLFAGAGDADNVGVDTKKEAEIAEKLVNMAVPMNEVEFTKENYNKLFPEGKSKTPIGDIKLGSHQFEKLKEKGREYLLGAMAQTLNDPLVILDTRDKDGREAILYLKSFTRVGTEKIKKVISVVVDIEGKLVSISTGERKEKQIENLIKMAKRILFNKNAPSPTIGTADTSNVAQQSTLSTSLAEMSSDNFDSDNFDS
ncbi:MAG: hypothetical protein Ta2B_30760 [Termitinemataceae bacterium]|nr:MAG: hypothetical protein Ta2B_30760 [Termitinemataceae bacterium]